MNNDYANAVRKGALAAGRLHQRLGLKQVIEARGGNIDVFDVIRILELPLILRPLEGLLGAYTHDPIAGLLITTRRSMSVQRFTAAHELGHFLLKHQSSLDDESILQQKSNFGEIDDYQEIEANAFASMFMMPLWLISWHSHRQGWSGGNFHLPVIVYQLSLRLGASYEATCWTLVRHQIIQVSDARNLLKTQPREIKKLLLGSHEPENYRGDVWLLTQRDSGTFIDGCRNDLFVIRLQEEHCDDGYLWDLRQLEGNGFSIVQDDFQESDAENNGSLRIRNVTIKVNTYFKGSIILDERRPLDPLSIISTIHINVDLTGPEVEGLSRAERRVWLENPRAQSEPS